MINFMIYSATNHRAIFLVLKRFQLQQLSNNRLNRIYQSTRFYYFMIDVYLY